MSRSIPRLRMFAGPNGSGKSTLKSVLPQELLGYYVNPDEIEAVINKKSVFSFNAYGLSISDEEIVEFFRNSELSNLGTKVRVEELVFRDGEVDFRQTKVNSYHASIIASLLRRSFIEQQVSFTFETVMSHAGKIEDIKLASANKYRIYLYYIATEDPMINISRIKNRVKSGGHSVDDETVRKRYHKSLDLLLDAIKQTDRAYIFDNSGDNKEKTWVAEITGGSEMEIKSDYVPVWFQRYVMDKLS